MILINYVFKNFQECKFIVLTLVAVIIRFQSRAAKLLFHYCVKTEIPLPILKKINCNFLPVHADAHQNES